MSLGKVVENRGDSLFCQQHKMTVTAFLPWVWLGGETVVRLQKGGSSAPPWGWQPARVEISAPGSGGGGQRDAIIISLCFSLNTIMGLASSSSACLGHWLQGRVSERRDRHLFLFPPPQLPKLPHLIVQKVQDALIPEQKQLKCCCTFLPSWEWLQNGKKYSGDVSCVGFGGDRGIAGSHVHLHELSAARVSQDMTVNTDKPSLRAEWAH